MRQDNILILTVQKKCISAPHEIHLKCLHNPSLSRTHTQTPLCPYTPHARYTDTMPTSCQLAPERPAENADWLGADCVVMETDSSPMCDLMKAT